MTEEETKNETVKIELSCFAMDKTFSAIFCKREDHIQKITFMYDKYCKGHNTAMTLTAGTDGIDAPNLDIYFDNDQLESLLEFLLKQKK